MTHSELRDEFHELLTRHQSQVFGYIFAAVRNLHDAQDLYQETCVAAWEKFRSFERGGSFARWACGIARLEILMYQRRHLREQRRLSQHVLLKLADVASDEDVEAAERRHRFLASCFAELNKADQRVVEMCYGTESKVSHVAEQLNMRLASLYNALSRIRRRLFQCIQRKLSKET